MRSIKKPTYRRVVEWGLGRNFGRKNNKAYNSYAKEFYDDENDLARDGYVRPRSETFIRQVGDQLLERRDDTRRTNFGRVKNKSVTRNVNVNTDVSELLSKVFNPRYKEKKKYDKQGNLVKAVKKGQGTGRSVKKYRS
jgi:hypothetical protein